MGIFIGIHFQEVLQTYVSFQAPKRNLMFYFTTDHWYRCGSSSTESVTFEDEYPLIPLPFGICLREAPWRSPVFPFISSTLAPKEKIRDVSLPSAFSLRLFL